MRGAGHQSPRSTRLRMHARTANKSVRPEGGRRQGTTGAEAEGKQGVGWPHTSDEVGKPVVSRKPAERRRPEQS